MRWRTKRSQIINPGRYAFALAGVYLIFSVMWILTSTWIAGFLASSLEELRAIETYKGLAFMVFTSGLLFLFSRLVFKRIADGAQSLLVSRHKLVDAERESIVGHLAASVAHDIANLLTIMRLNVERLKDIPSLPQKATEAIGRLDHSTDRLTEVAVRLKSAGRNQYRQAPRRFDFTMVIKDTIRMLRSHPHLQNCEIELVENGPVFLIGYPIMIHQLAMNLVLNAAEATSGQGRIRLSTGTEEGNAKLTIEDDGPGIPPSLRTTIFDAFFTTKRTGTGLGLLSVKTCVDLHQGKVEVGDSELGGACFSVVLPDLDDQRVRLNKGAELLN
ncbi:MAG TPA: HAMP domain-containing sensor histidine kinase [Bdellovibrionales bacterium]|nr:HAMP domain-containing sensor histidine kinase [Bdellovibrionales bacterium]